MKPRYDMYQILTELCTKFGDDWSFREETITKWTLNPLNFTTSSYYPTPYTPHPILLRTFVYKYI
ncbi:LOW QUALITY PROTEIN: hypothetical protein DAPPUDRAFT_305203 [Daphnia pulex]|uniref:Uncharacterized protein n=1 Tax=Daphnia pulex TaxID=6669 RepID=E9HVU3_DAPPU|nr:LOW QUALITY PROTEIN: hypothetical protein DAPPUDRAFT_305203 [Daphnia pulex]|eukprot:EFX64142.1 LOW QUALITY PROTEIN: hypothetical protein DAPPUDRAFT_305203 [Daphnia pulex]